MSASVGLAVVGELVAVVTIGQSQFDIAHAGLWTFRGNTFGFAPGFHDLTFEANWMGSGRANDINAAGLAVGCQLVAIDQTTNLTRAFVWNLPEDDHFPLGTFAIDQVQGSGGEAWGVNDLDPANVVGSANIPIWCLVSDEVTRGFLWQQGDDPTDLLQLIPLTGAEGNDSSWAFGIGSTLTDVVVGTSTGCASLQICQQSQEATWWNFAGSPTSLDPLPGDNGITGRGVNDSGTIVGWGRIDEESAVGCRVRAVVWEDVSEEPFDLHAGASPSLPAEQESRAEAINDVDANGRRQVVGTNTDAERAMLWESSEPEDWCAIDLNDLLHARQAARWSLARAHDINNAGLIVGEGLLDADEVLPRERGFLLTCGADLNGDGFVNGGDLGIVLATWECGEPSQTSLTCQGDYNFDGLVDGEDLGSVLALWGPCSLRHLCGGLESNALSAPEIGGGPPALLLTALQGLGFASIGEFSSWANGATAEQRASVVAFIEVAMSGQ